MIYAVYIRRPEMPKANQGKPVLHATFKTAEEAKAFIKATKQANPHLRLLVKEVPEVTEGQAREFFRDLCGTIHSNGSSGIMSVGLIADHMRISIEKANAFLDACLFYGITECQGGGWVV